MCRLQNSWAGEMVIEHMFTTSHRHIGKIHTVMLWLHIKPVTVATLKAC